MNSSIEKTELMAEQIDQLFETKKIHGIILGLIFLNAVIFTIEALPGDFKRWDGLLEWGDKIILSVFIIELSVRIVATRSKFFMNYWNVFDLIVTIISVVPSEFELSSIRVLRALHCMQLLEVIPRSKHILDGFVLAIPGLLNVFFLCFVFIFVFGLMATQLYGFILPNHFGHIGRSMHTLFNIIFTHSWIEITDQMPQNPQSWIFFSLYGVIVGICIYNMVVGAVVAATRSLHMQTALHMPRVSHTITSNMSGVDYHNLIQHLAILQQYLEHLNNVQTKITPSVKGDT